MLDIGFYFIEIQYISEVCICQSYKPYLDKKNSNLMTTRFSIINDVSGIYLLQRGAKIYKSTHGEHQ